MSIKVSKKWWLSIVVAVGLLVIVWVVSAVMAQEPEPASLTAPSGGSPTWTFTYQGQLNDDGRPADGYYDFIVSIWDDSTPGNQVGTAYTYDDPGVLVEDGIFSINVSPGDRSKVFSGRGRWIQLEVRPHGVGSYTTLSRQPITPVPYAWGLMPGVVVSSTVGPVFSAWTVGGSAISGYSVEDNGVFGSTSGTTVNDSGVYGVAGGTANGVHGYQADTPNGLGVYGKHAGGGSAVSGYNLGNGSGIWGYSEDYRGVASGTGRVDQNYGVHTSDNLYSLNYHKTGAMMQVVRNGDTRALERGDTVVVAGLSASSVGDTPILEVRSASEANSTAVLGVVASTYSAEWLADSASIDPTGSTGPASDIPLSSPGPIDPGEYMLVVVHGPCQVKVDAASTAIQPGDLLSTAGRSGYAAKADSVSIEGLDIVPPGTVFGKALEPLDARRDGLIYVFVTLQ
ncbi:MAG: hypothetical protein GY832_30135 [Chloroflexi bacterium]|nr:hypothetical protein [Chloroflexota bacterium]